MQPTMKCLSEQVVVITGATSGIGAAIARKAARRGATLVIAASDQDALQALADQLTRDGCSAVPFVTNAASEQEVHRLADETVGRFGRFDTWINNADASFYDSQEASAAGRKQSLRGDGYYRQVVHGSRIAGDYLLRSGGAIITVGIPNSDAAALMPNLCASLNKVGEFCGDLRAEMEKNRAPVAVTLIRPAPVDDVFSCHASDKDSLSLDVAAPVCPCEAVAEASLYAAEHLSRDVYVGAIGSTAPAAVHYTPCEKDAGTLNPTVPLSGRLRRDAHSL
jgi:short-subunit dehydrogenase